MFNRHPQAPRQQRLAPPARSYRTLWACEGCGRWRSAGSRAQRRSGTSDRDARSDLRARARVCPLHPAAEPRLKSPKRAPRLRWMRGWRAPPAPLAEDGATRNGATDNHQHHGGPGPSASIAAVSAADRGGQQRLRGAITMHRAHVLRRRSSAAFSSGSTHAPAS